MKAFQCPNCGEELERLLRSGRRNPTSRYYLRVCLKCRRIFELKLVEVGEL